MFKIIWFILFASFFCFAQDDDFSDSVETYLSKLSLKELKKLKLKNEQVIPIIDSQINQISIEKSNLKYSKAYMTLDSFENILPKNMGFSDSTTELDSIHWVRQILNHFENYPTDYNLDILKSNRFTKQHYNIFLKIGFLNEKIDSLTNRKNEIESENVTIDEQAEKTTSRDNLLFKYRKSKFKNAISKNKIAIGMTKEMVIDSWGDPENINRDVGSWGIHEQWIYNSTYLYFENGKLTAFQDRQ